MGHPFADRLNDREHAAQASAAVNACSRCLLIASSFPNLAHLNKKG
jgi:hypothetical protein